MLLLSDDPHWTLAVREAVGPAGGHVEVVSARTAVARLAGPGAQYTHVLVDPGAAGGLLGALADLTSDTASAETTLLLLGETAVPFAGASVIPFASRSLIEAALAVKPLPVRINTPALPPAALLEVLDGEMIGTWYQPVVRIADRRPVTVEVLARLNHPRHGVLTPDWFVPRFEDAGLAFRLTDMVSGRAFADQTGPDFSGLGLAMAVNYPLNVLSHPQAAAALDRKRADSGIPADRVVIELTESRPVEDFAALGRSLDRLRTLGYRIAIDDVGPAVKNLRRLLTLPFTGLKLDKGIVRRLTALGSRAAYAPRVIAQAHARGLNIVAEGVESRDTWDRLLALGVQEAQGFFVARPLPAAAVPVWLEAWTAAEP